MQIETLSTSSEKRFVRFFDTESLKRQNSVTLHETVTPAKGKILFCKHSHTFGSSHQYTPDEPETKIEVDLDPQAGRFVVVTGTFTRVVPPKRLPKFVRKVICVDVQLLLIFSEPQQVIAALDVEVEGCEEQRLGQPVVLKALRIPLAEMLDSNGNIRTEIAARELEPLHGFEFFGFDSERTDMVGLDSIPGVVSCSRPFVLSGSLQSESGGNRSEELTLLFSKPLEVADYE